VRRARLDDGRLAAGPIAAALPMALGWRVAFFIGVLPRLLVVLRAQGGRPTPTSSSKAKARSEKAGRTFLPGAIFRPELRRLTALACLLALARRARASR
jgi:hypothetical protein